MFTYVPLVPTNGDTILLELSPADSEIEIEIESYINHCSYNYVTEVVLLWLLESSIPENSLIDLYINSIVHTYQ